ncbi:MAG: hypothetical protein K9K82_13240 [Desulfobacteraceae bacterium]|nr:hypothetical protein [Desulfobacteraceae bacterium]
MAGVFRISGHGNDAPLRFHSGGVLRGSLRHLLIIYNQKNSAEAIGEDLRKDGYAVHLIPIKSLDCNQLKRSVYDLGIIQIEPDISIAWRTYRNLKKQFPDFPVLIYIRKSNMESLKMAVQDIFIRKIIYYEDRFAG